MCSQTSYTVRDNLPKQTITWSNVSIVLRLDTFLHYPDSFTGRRGPKERQLNKQMNYLKCCIFLPLIWCVDPKMKDLFDVNPEKEFIY